MIILYLFYRLQNQNDGAAGGNVQIKGKEYRSPILSKEYSIAYSLLRGSNIIMRSLCNVTRGAKSDALIFSVACRKRLIKTKLLCSSFSHFLGW